MSLQQTETDLLDAAIRVLAQKPRATLAEIAEQAGLSRATLHRVFPSRADLMRAAARQSLDIVEAKVASLALDTRPAADALAAVAGALVPMGSRFHFLVAEAWLDFDPEIGPRLDALNAGLLALVERARAEGVLRVTVSSLWQARAFDRLMYVGWEAIAAEELVPRDAVQAVLRLFLDGERPEATR